MTRRNLLLGGVGLSVKGAATPMKHLLIDGEWCFIGVPERKTDRAVIVFDGNGTTVGPDSSSWEKNAACSTLGQAVLSNGFVLAQSNRTANPKNGMWGNPASQKAVLALMSLLGKDYGIRRFSAITVSAGSVTLLNLLLDGKATFESAALFAPVVSLESMFRCPGGFDRVKGIGEAFQFKPIQGCPGDPEKDAGFRRATDGFDPMRRIRTGLPKNWRGSKTRWMVLYHHGDPKVLPPENGASFVQLLRRSGASVKEVAIDGNTHNSDDLMRDHQSEVVRLIIDGN